MGHPIVWVADVGSVAKGNFAWCRAPYGKPYLPGHDILEFADGIAKDLTAGLNVALGFECPLFVPVADNPQRLTSAREGEGNRSWSARAGCAALAVGLTEYAWVFEKIRKLAHGVAIRPSFSWEQFVDGKANLFIWEAFVSGASKHDTDRSDAETAARTFWSKYPAITEADDVKADNPFSLVAAALLRSGLAKELSMLSQKCVVLKSRD